ncbi:MAG TPA: STAS domain-containing protein [Bdellovibrionota bacterium]|jgi:anti-anti-sigma factor|nr:STAS domain-containing protein [Bdellovibrionota bacterium]
MRTNIRKEGDYTIVELSGFIDVESAEPVAEFIEETFESNEKTKMIVDMSNLRFVGSTGISNFVKEIRVFNKMRMKPTYYGMRSEFVRIFRLHEDQDKFDIVNSVDDAKRQALARFVEWQAATERSKETH